MPESTNIPRQIASPGSIKAEFEISSKRLNANRQVEDNLQAEASLALSRHLLLESSLEENSLDCPPVINDSVLSESSNRKNIGT